MKYIVISSLIGMSIVSTTAVPANADTFALHGYSTSYGR